MGILLRKKFIHRLESILEGEIFQFQRINYLNFERLDYLTKKNFYPELLEKKFGKIYLKSGHYQQIERNGSYEKKILSKSTLHIFPHEVAQIVAVDPFGEMLYSRFIHGGSSSVGSKGLILKELRKLIGKCRKNKFTIKKVILNHTHPSLDAELVHNKTEHLIIGGLSENDIALGKEVATKFKTIVHIRAITPRYNYSLAVLP